MNSEKVEIDVSSKHIGSKKLTYTEHKIIITTFEREGFSPLMHLELTDRVPIAMLNLYSVIRG